MGIRERLGQRIKEAREASGHTQQVVADTLNVNRAVISDWENGRTSPNLDRIDILADFFRKPVSYFFTEPTEMKGHSVENPAFYVRAYSRLVSELEKKKVESEKQAIGYDCLIAHFSAAASLLFRDLSAREQQKIRDEGGDTWIKHLAEQKAIPEGSEVAIELHSGDNLKQAESLLRSVEFASVNGFQRIIDETHQRNQLIHSDRIAIACLEAFCGIERGKTGYLWTETSASELASELPVNEATSKRLEELQRFSRDLDIAYKRKMYATEPLKHCRQFIESGLKLAERNTLDMIDDDENDGYFEGHMARAKKTFGHLSWTDVEDFERIARYYTWFASFMKSQAKAEGLDMEVPF
jgi:transcriptional regulator with XRE-family HTH domain